MGEDENIMEENEMMEEVSEMTENAAQEDIEEREASQNENEDANAAEEKESHPQEETEEKIRSEAKKQVDQWVKQMYGHLKNPYTGQNITTAEELERYQRAYNEEERKNKIAQTGIDEDTLNELIESHPAMVEAKRVMARQKEEQVKSFAEREFATVKQAFPECEYNSLSDFYETEEGKRAIVLWKKGISLADAYKTSHFDKIIERKVSAVKQGTMNQTNSKNHLMQPKGNEGERDDMTSEEVAMYRKFFPKMSEKEIKALHKKNKF